MSIKKELTTVKTLYSRSAELGGQRVTIGGWVRNLRSSNAFGFIELNDGSYFKPVQVVFEESKLDNYKDIAHQNIGAALKVTGVLELTPGAKQPFEIKAEEIEIAGTSTPDYPLQPKRHSPEFLRSIAHLRPRANTFNAVFRVRSVAAQGIHKFFAENGFVYVHTPIITTSDCEGAGEMFQVTTLDLNNIPKTEDGKVDFSQDFYGKPTNLTVSGQLNGETFAMAFRNIYTFGPTFRAENSNTTRHAAEFWMIEPEMAFADLDDLLRVEEDMLKYIISYVLEHAPEEMNFFNQFVDKGLIERLNHVVNSEFGHVTYTEAIELLEKNNDKFDYKVYWGCDLQTEHERYLTEEIFKRPVFVTDYPKEIKAFLDEYVYHYRKGNPTAMTSQQIRKRKREYALNFVDLYSRYMNTPKERNPIAPIMDDIAMQMGWYSIFYSLDLFAQYPWLAKAVRKAKMRFGTDVWIGAQIVTKIVAMFK